MTVDDKDITPSLTSFVRSEPLLREIALSVLESGQDHHGIEARFAALMILGDRLLASCVATADHGDLPRRVTDDLEALQRGDRAAGTDLLRNCLEGWLKAVLHRAKPTIYLAARARPRFTIYPTVLDLELLSKHEIDLPLESATQILDPVRRMILVAKEQRNPPTHGARSIDGYGADLRAGVVTMLAALDRHREKLAERLRTLILRPIPAAHVGLVRRVKSERDHRLSRFVGRDEFLHDVSRVVNEVAGDGGYLVITAPEGFGKSAVAGRLTEHANKDQGSLGAASLQVTREAPWLPAMLFHAGKQSKDPMEFVSSLVGQANCLLVRPIPPVVLQEQPSVIDSVPGYSVQGSDERERRRIPMQPVAVGLRAKLYEVLDRLVEERGSAVLVIDALDEIGSTAADLEFLPEPLPRGAVVVLTSRPEDKLLEVLRHQLHAKQLVLEGLSLDEVAGLTQVTDNDWNRVLQARCSGAPLYVTEVAKRLRDLDGNYKEVDLPASMNAIFHAQIERWRMGGMDEAKDPLHATLALLTVFEPLAPLAIDLIQSFLQSRNIHLSGRELRTRLEPIASQIEGLDTNRIKLTVRAFAEYVRDSVLSKRDLRQLLSEVSAWLADEPDADPELLSSYLRRWTDPDLTADDQQRLSTESLVAQLVLKQRSDTLLAVWERQPKRTKSRARDTLLAGLKTIAADGSIDAMYKLGVHADRFLKSAEEARAWFSKAAEKGHPSATLKFGEMLLDGIGGPRLQNEGEMTIRRSIALGEPRARHALSDRLLDGRGLTCEPVEGERLAREAAATDQISKALLAERLLDGRGLPRTPEEGQRLLRQVATENPVLKLLLAERLLFGRGFPHASDEGERLLREAAAQDALAKFLLAGKLLDGIVITRNVQEGERLLREASTESPVAKLELAERLLDGDGLSLSPEEGERLLREVALEDTAAKLRLAERRLDGVGLLREPTEGERLLREAASEDPEAKLNLSERLFDGRGLPQSLAEAERFIREAAEEHASAKLELGERLLDGRGTERDRDQGESLVRDAARTDARARRRLASRLLDGTVRPDSQNEGELLLRRSAAETPSANRELGARLLDGRGLARCQDEGERIIREAAAIDPTAKVELAERLLDGRGFPSALAEGERLLREVAESHVEGKRALASRLFTGRGVPIDVKAAEHLLRVAAQDSTAAQAQLGERLLDGIVLQRAPGEGERLLRAAATRHPIAKLNLGCRLLDGRGLSRRSEEGERLIRDVVAYHPAAKLELGERLLEGRGLSANPLEGERLLRDAAVAYAPAKLALGQRLLNGEGLAPELVDGERLLRGAAVDLASAKAALAERLLDGRVLAQAPVEGERLLREAAAENSHAMLQLAVRLLRGQGVGRAPAEGEVLLRHAATADTDAREELAERLLDGRGIVRDPQQGERLLRDVAATSSEAKLKLARRLLDGDGLAMAVDEGERILRELAETEEAAKISLAERLLDGWGLPCDSKEGERLLRELATVSARSKQSLAKRLLDGAGLTRSSKEGKALLREAAREDVDAKLELASRMLDGKGLPRMPTEGERLLREVASESSRGKFELGHRLLDGRGLETDIDAGEKLLREAARDTPKAMLELAQRLISGRLGSHASDEGQRLLDKIVAEELLDADAFDSAGTVTYQKALAAKEPAEKKYLLQCAARSFSVAFMLGSTDGGNDLAYMCRRGEVSSEACPTLDELLQPGLARNLPFPRVNQALRLAAGIQCDSDWRAADVLVAALAPKEAEEVLDWWLDRSKEGDLEGGLVIGWLVRHHLIADPNKETIAKRMSHARRGWAVPTWMDKAVERSPALPPTTSTRGQTRRANHLGSRSSKS